MSNTLCPACNGSGITPGRQWLKLAVMVLLEGGALGFHQNLVSHLYVRRTLPYVEQRPGRDLGELCVGLAGRPPDEHMGHDGIDVHMTTEKIIRAAGFDPAIWGMCPDCKGSGSTQQQAEKDNE